MLAPATLRSTDRSICTTQGGILRTCHQNTQALTIWTRASLSETTQVGVKASNQRQGGSVQRGRQAQQGHRETETV